MDIMDINTQFDTATQGRTAFSGVSLQQGWIKQGYGRDCDPERY